MGVSGGSNDWLTGRATPLRPKPLYVYEDWLLELIIRCGVNTPIDASIKEMTEYEYNAAALALKHMTSHYSLDTESRWYVITDKAKQYIELMDKNETV